MSAFVRQSAKRALYLISYKNLENDGNSLHKSDRREEPVSCCLTKSSIAIHQVHSSPDNALWPIFCPLEEGMDRLCQHCGELIVGNVYRVTSKEKGITLLNMIVCCLCFMAAKRLRLHAEEINLRSKQTSATRNRGTHRLEPGI
jgi:hypothetical protein